MKNDHAATRRTFLQAGAGALGTTLHAGCTGNSDPETPSTGTFTPSETEMPEGNSSYSVTKSPVGEVTFDGVPTDVMVYNLLYADMAVAYGHGDAVNYLGFDAKAGGNTLDEQLFNRERLANVVTSEN